MGAYLTILVVVFAAAIVVAALVIFVRDLGRPLVLDRSVIVLAGLVAIRGLVDVALMLAGEQAVNDATHLGYLITSVLALPATLQFLEGDRSKWSSAVLGVACLATLVLAIRLEVTAHA